VQASITLTPRILISLELVPRAVILTAGYTTLQSPGVSKQMPGPGCTLGWNPGISIFFKVPAVGGRVSPNE
jgi:hypothetical protein